MDTEERALWKSDAERYAGESYSAWPNRVLALLEEVDRLTEALEAAERERDDMERQIHEDGGFIWRMVDSDVRAERAEADLADRDAERLRWHNSLQIATDEAEQLECNLADEKQQYAELRAGLEAVLDKRLMTVVFVSDLQDLLSDTTGELTEQGRALASQRDDLIARGVNPAELAIPIAPDATGDET